MDFDAIVSTAQAALLACVSVVLIRKWISRGLLRRIGKGVRAGDVLAVEASTRQTVKRRGGRARTVLA